jgi:hypothetical protein
METKVFFGVEGLYWVVAESSIGSAEVVVVRVVCDSNRRSGEDL